MKSKILQLAFILIAFTGCKGDQNCNTNTDICGIWHLTHVSGGFAGINDNFDKGIITWTFNENSQQLKVINTNSENNIYDGFESGTYSYSINEVEDQKFISINNESLGEIIQVQSKLTIDQNSSEGGYGADGFILSLDR